jgi:hypothetical protein
MNYWYISVKRWLLSFCYTKEAVVNQYVEGRFTFVESVSINRTITRCKMWNTAQEARKLTQSEIRYILTQAVETPWLWIGADSLLGCIDMTSSLEVFLVPSNKICLKFLEHRYPYYYNWKIVDSARFTEMDFPTNGITINATGMERLEKIF